MDVTGLELGWVDVAGHTRRGGAKAAVILARFDRGNAGTQAHVMLMRPKTLILCFETVAGRRRRGEPPPEPKVTRRLTDATEARLLPGAIKGRADQLRLDQAYREFRGGQELDGEDAPAALPPPDLAPAFVPLLERSRYKGAHGGRGSGKSHVFAELLVRRCIEAAPVRAVCIREVQRSLDQSVKRLIEV